MLSGRPVLSRVRPLGLAFFASLWAAAGVCPAWGLSLESQAQGLAHYIVAVYDDFHGDAPQAVAEYRNSIRYNRLEAAPRLKLGGHYLNSNQPDRAVNELKAATRLDPEDPQAHYLLCLLYLSERKYGLAASESDALLKLTSRPAPGNEDAEVYLGEIFYAQKMYPQAIEQFVKVVNADPGNTATLLALGSVYADNGEHGRAIAAFRKVLDAQPENDEALNALAYVYAQDGVHLDEAVEMIRKAIAASPHNGAYHDSLGWALYKQGMYDQSLAALRRAQKYIVDETLYDHLGDVFKALKEFPAACKYWHKSLDMDPQQVSVKAKVTMECAGFGADPKAGSGRAQAK